MTARTTHPPERPFGVPGARDAGTVRVGEPGNEHGSTEG